jgi:hypothetical protein
MIVGREHFEVSEELGSREKFLEFKRYLDGRHTVRDICDSTGLPDTNVDALIASFEQMGLLRSETPQINIPAKDFVERIDATCAMWSRQIGFHRLFGLLQQGSVRKEVFQGLMLETYHYVNSAAKHIAVAIAHCGDSQHRTLLQRYFVDEHDHAELLLRTLENIGISRDLALSAHPVIGTLSLINMLCDIGRTSTLAYLCCTSLFEARKTEASAGQAAFERIAANYNWSVEDVSPIVSHLLQDVAADHTSLIAEALRDTEYVTAADADRAVNGLHDLKHSFDQFHDQILSYYIDISNYIPRLKVDYFSL